jgi:hypothetical protein
MILEAAKSIAAANSALVKAASAAQRELIDQGKVRRNEIVSLVAVVYPGIILGWRGSTNSDEDRENGHLGVVAP